VSGRRVTVVASEVLGVPGSGGPGTADSLLALALARHGHEVRLLIAPGRKMDVPAHVWAQRYRDTGVTLHPIDGDTRVRPAFLGPIYAVFEELLLDPPDVVVADDWRGLGYAALRARQLGSGLQSTAFVVYCHGPARVLAEAARKVPDTLARFGEEVAERACLALADAVVSPSAWLLEWMRRHDWPVPESAQVVQYLWQSVALGESSLQAEPAPVNRLAFFGQLREGKGLALYTRALRELDPALLEGRELLFLGRETPRWTTSRISEALGPVSGSVAAVRFETQLDRSGALSELLRPGTLAVMPSLVENSPLAVSECIEHAVPFLAARVGGVPDLVAPDDRDRVLCEPAVADVAAALTRALDSSEPFAPARPARSPEDSLRSWLELIEGVTPREALPAKRLRSVSVVAIDEVAAPRAHGLARATSTVEADVVEATSRSDGLARATADWVLFLDADDDPDSGLLDELAAAQAASGADIVTAAVRPADDLDTVQLFLGDPGALGLVENHYGVVALVRRELLTGRDLADGSDPDWPLLARLVLEGARVVSIPRPLSTLTGRPGSVAHVPGEGLSVLELFEGADPARLADLPQLAATVAAAFEKRAAHTQPDVRAAGVLRRGLRVLRSEGISGVTRRARRRT